MYPFSEAQLIFLETEISMKMVKKGQKLIVIGDRVLIAPEEASTRTEIGLYLPQTVVEKEQVQSGRVIAVGPGIPFPDPGSTEDEPWRAPTHAPKYLPVQVQEGDFALFLKKAAIDIKWEEDKYLIVPQAAILVVLRKHRHDPGDPSLDISLE